MIENGQEPYAPGGITLCPDGKYCWVYELKLLKTPAILCVIWKIIVGAFLGVWLFVMLLSLGDTHFWWDGFWSEAKMFALLTALMLALSLLAYLFYAAVMGGKYCVLFEMDENGIRHTQAPRQFKKAQLLAAITALSGMKSGHIGTVGTGLLAGSKVSSYSEWHLVKSIAVHPRLNLIKVNAPLNKNQVYAEDTDFAFVRQYILTHCAEAKLRE